MILASRRGSSVPEVATLKQELAAFGATIDVCRCDVGDRKQVEEIIASSGKGLGPIRGVIHGAMALEVCEVVPLKSFNLSC